jgi:CelD/BcsL family acetyltransferase involved in cellulose biosynthesis
LRDLKIVTIDPATDGRWATLLNVNTAGLFHSPPWLRAVSDTYSFDIRAHIAIDAEDVPRGGIAFSMVNDIFGQRVVSLPFSDVCEPLVTTPDVWPNLFARLRKHEVPLHLRCLGKLIERSDTRLNVTKRARWHTLSVAGDPKSIWASFHASARRAIRKAEHGQVVVRPMEGPDSVEGFHRLHVALRKQKYRLLAQPIEFFEAIRHRFDKASGWFPLGAFLEDQLVAATVYLRWRDTLYYKFNASRLSALEMRPNHLLVWAGILLAKSLGCSKLDLGPSDDDQPGLIQFKRQFGATERELSFLRYLPSEWQDEQGSELRSLLHKLTQLLTSPDVPDDVAARAGAQLYRYFV